MSDTADWTHVADLVDFAGQRKLARKLDGLDLLLLRDGADVIVAHNYCPHLGRPLDGGRLMAGQLTCPFHGACFDVRTGAAKSGPAVSPLHLFPSRLEGEAVMVDLRKKPPMLLGLSPASQVTKTS